MNAKFAFNLDWAVDEQLDAFRARAKATARRHVDASWAAFALRRPTAYVESARARRCHEAACETRPNCKCYAGREIDMEYERAPPSAPAPTGCED